MDFCDKLMSLRRAKGLSQEQLADLAGVSRQAVGKWESGRSMPDLEKLISLSDLFDVTLDELVRNNFERMDYAAVQSFSDLGKPADQPYGVYGAANLGKGIWAPSYEYKSSCTFWGLPLVHINFGYVRPRVARGVFALGNIAVGFFALGGVSIGLFGLGGISLGLLFSLGGISLGGLSIGGCAVGVFAAGGLALGLYAIGGCAVGGLISAGGAAFGPFSIGANNGALINSNNAMLDAQSLRALLDAAHPGTPNLIRLIFTHFF